jgi:hypothetical protein
MSYTIALIVVLTLEILKQVKAKKLTPQYLTFAFYRGSNIQ